MFITLQRIKISDYTITMPERKKVKYTVLRNLFYP